MADAEDIERFHAGELDLSQSDYRQANLSERDFRGRDLTGTKFSGANIVGTRFDGCNLRTTDLSSVDASGASFIDTIMPMPLFGVNFSGAILRGASFHQSHLAQCNFSRADLTGADFRSAKFDANVVFDGATIDEKTDFEDAEVLRPASRLSIFSNYNFERGVLKRKTAAPDMGANENPREDVRHADSSFTAFSDSTSSLAVELTRVRASLQQSAGSPREMAASLALAVQEHIDLIAGSKPNDPHQLAYFESYVELLETIAKGLWSIAQKLDEVERLPTSERTEIALDTAGNLVMDLSRGIRNWVDSNGHQLFGTVVSGGMICTLSSFFSAHGASPTLAFPTAAALVGGKTLSEAVAVMLKTSKGDKDKG